jgi:hypothetical protein
MDTGGNLMTKARDLANAADVLDDVSATELGHLDGVTSAIQTQLDAKQAVVSGVNDTEIGYLDGVTSAIQTQIDAKTAKSTLTTTGDIYYASAANTPARLAIGSTSDVLTVVAGVPGWAAPAAGGISFTELSSSTATGSSTISFTGLSSYNTIMVKWSVLSSTSNSRFLITCDSDASNAKTFSIEAVQNGTDAYGENYGGEINLTGYALLASGNNCSGQIIIYNCKQSTPKPYEFFGNVSSNIITGGGLYTKGAISTLEFKAGAGTIDSNSGVTIWGSTI